MNKALQGPEKAMIFAAGLGTRLRPYTNTRPKALVEVNGAPLLFHAIRKLENAGVKEVVVNVHHFADMVIDYLNGNHWECTIHISDERDLLLDTGGGLLKAAPLLRSNDPVLVTNVDILTDLDIEKFYTHHLKQGAAVTLAVRDRKTSRQLLFDDSHHLIGWRNAEKGDYKWVGNARPHFTAMAFSGVHLFNPGFLEQMLPPGPVFSIIDIWLEMAAHHRILGYEHTQDFWLDVGKPEALNTAEAWIIAQRMDGLD